MTGLLTSPATCWLAERPYQWRCLASLTELGGACLSRRRAWDRCLGLWLLAAWRRRGIDCCWPWTSFRARSRRIHAGFDFVERIIESLTPGRRPVSDLCALNRRTARRAAFWSASMLTDMTVDGVGRFA